MKKKLPTYIANRLTFEDLASSRGLLQLTDRLGRVTQRQAAEELGLSPGTCNLHFQKLEHLGLIRRAASVNGRGRATIQWAIEQKKNMCIVIVVDVPFFLAAMTDFEGTVLLSEREDLTGLVDVTELENLVDRFVDKALQLAEEQETLIRQVFMGLPGILDPTHSKVLQSANLPVLNNVDFKALMKERHDLPSYCSPLGMAFYYGEIEQLPADTRAMVLFWDLGIGVVAGVGDRVISHSHEELALSEIGHLRIKNKGALCHCGRNGCLEAYTGGWAMIDKLDREDITSLNDFLHAVEAGDADALRVASDAARVLGESLCWPIQVMESERLIVSGPLSPIFNHVRPAMLEGLGVMFSEDEIARLNPQASSDPQQAMQKGAARLARRLYIYPEL